MTTFDRKQYYFENLIHMAFLGKYIGKGYRVEVGEINQKIKLLLEKNYDGDYSLYEYYNADKSIETLIKLIIVDEKVVEEYLSALKLVLSKQYDKATDTRWTYFEVNKVVNSVKKETYAIKSSSPDGILTHFSPFGDFISDGGIYIDIYTVPQIDHNQIVGIQTLFPIVNERRNLYIKNKKESELHIFHSLLVDMKNHAPSLLNNVLTHEKHLPEKARKTITAVKDYINSAIDQSKKVLSLFSEYAYSDYVFKQVKISRLELIAKKKVADFKGIIKVSLKCDKALSKYSTLLIPEVLDYFLDQLIKNAIKEYLKNDTPEEKREIIIKFIEVTLDKKPALKISVISKNTFINSPILLDQAGKRPVNSKTSTGLGFYFLNTLLELLKASLPENRKDRYFDLSSKEGKGVLFDFYYLIM